MNIDVIQAGGDVPVTILRLDGDLDAKSYTQLIDTGREVIAGGATDILLDIRGVPYMGSSGIVAIHSLVLMLAGEEPPDPESGWSAHHAMASSVESGMQQHLRLLGPGTAVQRVLERTGMTKFIDVHDDEAAAIAAFG
jgi:anti-anti-sigma regulatory factor